MNTICKLCNLVCKNYQGLSRHLRIQHNISSKDYYDKYYKQPTEGICPVCSKPTAFRSFSVGYLRHCSSKCLANDPNVINKTNQTNLKRYGTEIYVHSKDFKEKTKNTNTLKYGNEWFIGSDIGKKRIIATNKLKYNTDYPLTNKEVKQKADNTQKSLYGSIFMKSDSFKEKSIRYSQIHYGTDYFMSTQEFADKSYISKLQISHLGLRIENNCFERLSTNFKVIRQYKNDKYPFLCDFYIPKLDLYIECNFFWTHGKHYFDDANENDINILRSWKEKQTKYYKSAIRTWTKSDPLKKEYAIKNNLNFIVVWNIEQFNKFYRDLANKNFIGFVDYNKEI